jgi:hypothetical protein
MHLCQWYADCRNEILFLCVLHTSRSVLSHSLLIAAYYVDCLFNLSSVSSLIQASHFLLQFSICRLVDHIRNTMVGENGILGTCGAI